MKHDSQHRELRSREGSASGNEQPRLVPRGQPRVQLNALRAQEIRGQEVERQSHDLRPPASRGRVSRPLQRAPVRQLWSALRSMDATAAAKYQDIYAAARKHDGFDEGRYLASLTGAGIDPLTQRELHRLALEADAEGRATLFPSDVLATLAKLA